MVVERRGPAEEASCTGRENWEMEERRKGRRLGREYEGVYGEMERKERVK